MRSVVLGGSGFLGQALIEELAARGRDIVAVDRHPVSATGALDARIARVAADITDSTSLTAAFEGADEVYHLAGDLGTAELDDRLRSCVETNVLGSLNVFETAVAAHVPRVFFASKVHHWLNAYTATKHCAEQLARIVTQQHPVRICSLRYLNLFGPRQKLYPVRKVVPMFAIQAMRGLPLQVFGNGDQTVDMLFVKDAARVTVDYLEAGFVDRALDFGTGFDMTVNQLAQNVNDHFGNSAGIVHLPMRRGEIPNTRVVSDPAPLEAVLGKLTFVEWSVALKETLGWYEALDPHDIDAALAYHGVACAFDSSWTL